MKLNGIKETVIYVNDLSMIKSFYGSLFDLKQFAYEPGKHLFYKIGNSMLLFFNPEDSKTNAALPSHFAHGPQHFAFEVDREEYGDWKEKVANFVEIEHEQHWHNGIFSFYFRDPENNLVEIVMKGMWR